MAAEDHRHACGPHQHSHQCTRSRPPRVWDEQLLICSSRVRLRSSRGAQQLFWDLHKCRHMKTASDQSQLDIFIPQKRSSHIYNSNFTITTRSLHIKVGQKRVGQNTQEQLHGHLSRRSGPGSPGEPERQQPGQRWQLLPGGRFLLFWAQQLFDLKV